MYYYLYSFAVHNSKFVWREARSRNYSLAFRVLKIILFDPLCVIISIVLPNTIIESLFPLNLSTLGYSRATDPVWDWPDPTFKKIDSKN